jgi:hypothetical protein
MRAPQRVQVLLLEVPAAEGLEGQVAGQQLYPLLVPRVTVGVAA